jgi:hypothetical protein
VTTTVGVASETVIGNCVTMELPPPPQPKMARDDPHQATHSRRFHFN